MGAKTPIPYSEIPDKMFMPAIKVREIVRARPLSYDERKNNKRGSPDIMIEPLIGKPYYLSRDDVINNFTYTNKKKIRTTGWESDKQYLIFRQDGTMVKAMQVPVNHTVEVNGVVANSSNRSRGDYIVCLCTEDGLIDRSTASVLSAAIFRKLCYIPMNEVIERHQGSRNTIFNMAVNKIAQHIPPGIKNATLSRGNNHTRETSGPTSGAGVPTRETSVRNTSFGVSNNPLPSQVVANKPTGSDGYEIIAQIHDDFGKRIGYCIKAPSGEIRKINKRMALELANRKKLNNATIVERPNGEVFLRGVGIQLDNLPIEYK